MEGGEDVGEVGVAFGEVILQVGVGRRMGAAVEFDLGFGTGGADDDFGAVGKPEA